MGDQVFHDLHRTSGESPVLLLTAQQYKTNDEGIPSRAKVEAAQSPFMASMVVGLIVSALTSVSGYAGPKGQATDLPVFDSDFECFTQDQANRYINDFNIDYKSFGGMELCDAAVDTKKLLNDLYLVENGQFDTQVDKNMFIKDFVDTQNYYSWLKSMTYGVERGNDIPAATAYNSGGYFTMQDGWAQLSTLGRVGTIIHEARHTEGYYHRSCTNGPYKDTGVSGCDRSVAEGGSHGVEMEYYSRVVLQGKNFHPVYKTMARLMNLGRANFVFNTLPMVKREALFGFNGELAVLLDGQTSKQMNFINKESFQLKRTSFGASLHLGHEAFAVDLYQTSQKEQLIEDNYSYYKILKFNKGITLVDLQEFDVGVKRHLVGLDAKGNVYRYVFDQAEWEKATTVAQASMLVTTAPNGEKGLFVLKTTGEVCKLNLSQNKCVNITESWNPQVETYLVYDGKTLELRQDGRVYMTNSGQLYDLLSGYQFTQLTDAPLYDAFAMGM